MDLQLSLGWARLGGLAVVAVLAYLWLVVVLRVTGKRTLAKLNAFDFVVTVALGSTLSSVIVSRDLPLVEGLTALAALVALQFVVAWSIRRWELVDHLAKARPTALLLDGRVRPEAMVRNRIRADEVAAALRKEGVGEFEGVDAVVLETDGTLSVVVDAGGGSALEGVVGAEHLVTDGDRSRPPGRG
jgi:uncharacterized membrane protein YcaP (DUF421 family)